MKKLILSLALLACVPVFAQGEQDGQRMPVGQLGQPVHRTATRDAA